MMVCKSCTSEKPLTQFQFRSDTGLYRRSCNSCLNESKNITRRIRSKTLTEDQKEKLKNIWKKSNRNKQLKKIAERQAAIEIDFKRVERSCTNCGLLPKEKFDQYHSSRVNRIIFKSKCKDCLATARRNKERTVRGAFSNYKTDAKKRDLIFDLSLDEFEILLNGSCKYCGKDKAWGVDRVDSSTGYFTDNCVSCCRMCNQVKMHHPVSEMYAHIEKMLNHHKGMS